MKILSKKTISLTKWICLSVIHNRTKFEIDVNVTDGKMVGGISTGIHTASLKYFNLPEVVRKKHFTQIKKAVEQKNSKLSKL